MTAPTKEDIRNATVEMLRRWADQIERGEAEVTKLEQSVATGYYESPWSGQKFFYRKNPLMITLHLNLDTFKKEAEEAAMKALLPDNDR